MNQTWTFNDNELATWDDAINLRSQMNVYRETNGLYMAGGVLPIVYTTDEKNIDNAKSGIYIPEWEAGPAGFPVPSSEDAESVKKYFLHFRFVSGRAGVNVGLILDKIKRFGGNVDYVFHYLNSGDLS